MRARGKVEPVQTRPSSGLLMARRRLISRAPMAWELRQSIAWRQAALFPASSQREAAKEMSERKPITREQLEQLIELLEQPVAPSAGDEALIRAVMADHGWSYEEARERLELSGM